MTRIAAFIIALLVPTMVFAVDWQQWSDGASGKPRVSGNQSSGRAVLHLGEEAYSAVGEAADSSSKDFLLGTVNVTGNIELFYRTAISSFATADNGIPWVHCSSPPCSDVHEFKYSQAKIVGGQINTWDSLFYQVENQIAGNGMINTAGSFEDIYAFHGWQNDPSVYYNGKTYIFYYGFPYNISDETYISTQCVIYDHNKNTYSYPEFIVLSGNDPHNYFSAAVDSNGYIFLVGGCHEAKAKFLYTTTAEDISNWLVFDTATPNSICTGSGTPASCCTGSGTGTCTYPWDTDMTYMKILCDGSDNLTVIGRSWNSGTGDRELVRLWRSTSARVRSNIYDWDPGISLFRPMDTGYPTYRPYHGRVSTDSNGDIHIANTWRHGDLASQFHDISYARVKVDKTTDWTQISSTDEYYTEAIAFEPSAVYWDDTQLTETTGTDCSGGDDLTDDHWCWNSGSSRVVIQGASGDYNPSGNTIQAAAAYKASGTLQPTLPIQEGGGNEDLAYDGTYVLVSDVDTDSNDEAFIAYIKEVGSPETYFADTDVYLAHYNGASWDNTVVPSALGGRTYHAQIIVDTEDNMSIYIPDEDGIDEYYTTRARYDLDDTDWDTTNIITMDHPYHTPSPAVSHNHVNGNRREMFFSKGPMQVNHLLRNPNLARGLSAETWSIDPCVLDNWTSAGSDEYYTTELGGSIATMGFIFWDDTRMSFTATSSPGSLTDGEWCWDNTNSRVYVQGWTGDYNPSGNVITAFNEDQAMPSVGGGRIDFKASRTEIYVKAVQVLDSTLDTDTQWRWDFTINVHNGQNNCLGYYGLFTSDDYIKAHYDNASSDGIIVYLYGGSTYDSYINIVALAGINQTTGTAFDLADETDYYARVESNGTTASLKLYTDKARKTLVADCGSVTISSLGNMTHKIIGNYADNTDGYRDINYSISDDRLMVP
jgi:hypothetical protein